MKKYSSAIKCLREKIKSLAAQGKGIRQEIHTLTWKATPEALEALRTVREARKAGGRKTIGKRLLKPYRRPETGSMRQRLRWKKQEVGQQAHCVLLAMGLLKGRAYADTGQVIAMPKVPSYYQGILRENLAKDILDCIYEALRDDEALKDEWSKERIRDWLQGIPSQEEAA